MTHQTIAPEIDIFVAGIPAPQGSKKFLGTYVSKKDGRTHGIMGESSKKVAPWRADVRNALTGQDGKPKAKFGDDSAIRAGLQFIIPRPLSLSKKKKTPPAKKRPDIDKLVRSTFDAIKSAGVYGDDSRVVGFFFLNKRYAEIGEPTGCRILLAAEPE